MIPISKYFVCIYTHYGFDTTRKLNSKRKLSWEQKTRNYYSSNLRKNYIKRTSEKSINIYLLTLRHNTSHIIILSFHFKNSWEHPSHAEVLNNQIKQKYIHIFIGFHLINFQRWVFVGAIGRKLVKTFRLIQNVANAFNTFK